MKYWMMALLSLSLTGCATTEVALTSDGKPEAGTLQLVRLGPNQAEIALDGKRYAGEWADSRCFTPQCRGEFFNVPKTQRRHIRKGSAELAAQDDSSLNCEWVSHEVSHDKNVIGTCQASDGRQFKLMGG